MKSILEKQLNIWIKHVNHKAFRTIHEIYKGIKEGKLSSLILVIRQLYSIGNAKQADDLKRNLPSFASAGIFDETKNRKMENLKEYTGVLTLDVDGLLPKQVNEIKERAKAIPYTLIAFVSPSGLGVKILVVVDSPLEVYKQTYQQVSKYYEDELGVPLDKQTSDVARLCYMSYDPDAYLNEDAEIFRTSTIKAQSLVVDLPNVSNINSQLDQVVIFTENVKKFENGCRNSFILTLACNCNRYGFEKEKVLSCLIERYVQKNFTKEEIRRTVESAYKNNFKQFNTWKLKTRQDDKKEVVDKSEVVEEKADVGKMEVIDEKEEITFDSPFIDAFVKSNLPQFIKDILVRLTSEREKDVFITGVLTVLSGATNVFGYYKEKKYYSHLFSFISAPPASGKGALIYCNQLLLPLHKKMKKESEERMIEYEAAMIIYKENKAAGIRGEEKPEKPLFQTLYIPANSSTSQLTEHLQNNGEQGIIIETEADTLVKTLESDFGNYSDILRKTFHHEMVSQRRKTNKEYIEIYNPRLAVALSGTPNQLSKLIDSVENGLFSRFIYYVFQSTPKWSDVSPQSNNTMPLPEFVEQIGNWLADELLNYRIEPIKFDLSKNQWAELNRIFNERLKELSCYIGEDASANVFRLGIVAFRLAMTLTIFKMLERKQRNTNVICDDLEFNMAMSLSETYYKHLVFAFKLVRNKEEVLNMSLKKFFDALPIEFDRKLSIECAKNSGISSHERTLDKYLKRLVDYNYLIKGDYNNYKKVGFENGLKKAA